MIKRESIEKRIEEEFALTTNEKNMIDDLNERLDGIRRSMDQMRCVLHDDLFDKSIGMNLRRCWMRSRRRKILVEDQLTL